MHKTNTGPSEVEGVTPFSHGSLDVREVGSGSCSGSVVSVGSSGPSHSLYVHICDSNVHRQCTVVTDCVCLFSRCSLFTLTTSEVFGVRRPRPTEESSTLLTRPLDSLLLYLRGLPTSGLSLGSARGTVWSEEVPTRREWFRAGLPSVCRPS